MGWRGDVRDSYVTSLTAFKAANPTLVTHIYRARPPALTDAKSIYVAGISEAIAHDSGTRRREASVDLACCVALGENAETTDALEDLADGLVDWLTTNYGLTGALTFQEPVRTTTAEIADGGTFIPAIIVTARAFIQQGRT